MVWGPYVHVPTWRRPRGGANAIINDLRRLPPTVPPLLGRSALARQRDAGVAETSLEFSLTWGDKRLRVTSPAVSAPTGAAAHESSGGPSRGGAGVGRTPPADSPPTPPTGVCVEETRLGRGQPRSNHITRSFIRAQLERRRLTAVYTRALHGQTLVVYQYTM